MEVCMVDWHDHMLFLACRKICLLHVTVHHLHQQFHTSRIKWFRRSKQGRCTQWKWYFRNSLRDILNVFWQMCFLISEIFVNRSISPYNSHLLILSTLFCICSIRQLKPVRPHFIHSSLLYVPLLYMHISVRNYSAPS